MNTILDKSFVPYQFDLVVLSNLRLFFPDRVQMDF